MRFILITCSLIFVLVTGNYSAAAGELNSALFNLRQLAVKERPAGTLQVRPSLFNQNGDIDINALRRIIDETMADLSITNADISEDDGPLIIGSAIYLAKDDNTVSPELLGDIDIMFDKAGERGGGRVLKLREIFVKKLCERFIETMGVANVSGIEKGFAPDAVEMENEAFYEFGVTGQRGRKITLSFPPPVYSDAAEFVWASVSETVNSIIKKGESAFLKGKWAAYPDKMVKRCMEAAYYLTADTDQRKIFRGLKGMYIDTVERSRNEREGKRQDFIKEFYVKHFLPTFWRLQLTARFDSIAGDANAVARFKGLIRQAAYGEGGVMPAPLVFQDLLAIQAGV